MSGGPTLPHDWFPRPLPANVVIGERSWLYSSFAFLHFRSLRPCGVRIGRDSGVYAGSFFEVGPFGEVTIGDFCSIVGAILRTDRRITIGDYTFIAHDVVLADAALAVPPPVGPAPSAGEVGGPGAPPGDSIRLGDNVWVGARAVILGGSTVGEGAIVGAGAVVAGTVPAFAIVAGNPARIVGDARR